MELNTFLLTLNIESPLSLTELYKKFGIGAEAEHAKNIERLKASLIQASRSNLSSQDLACLKRELLAIKENNIKIVTIFDKDYPLNLRNIFDPPSLIYVKGNLEESDVCSVAVVGSRKASMVGLDFTRNLTFSLSKRGLTVNSGLALGIDAAAHMGALEGGGRTVAVLGSGFGHMYPVRNRNLAKRIVSSGAVITEFSYFSRPARYNFPRRNRIISGLSLGVVVVEAAERSGSLITADFALEQGREVFAVPGFADSPNSKGTNRLIKQGAALVENELDIIESLPEHIKQYLNKKYSEQ